MPLNTNNLLLQEITPADIPAIHALHSQPEVDRYNTLGIPASLQETQALISGWINAQSLEPGGRTVYSVFLKRTQQFIGLFGLTMGRVNYRSAEIWYILHPDFWGKGYATEAVKEVLRYCFSDLGLHRVEAGCAVENSGSIRVLEKAGMQREGHRRKLLPIRGGWADNYTYAILEEDYAANGPA